MKERQQDIEHSDYRGQPCSNVGLQAMMDALEMAHDGHHRQSGLNSHPIIPRAFGTQLTVVGNALHTAEAIIGQDNALSVDAFDHGMEVLIMDIHRSPIPGHDLSSVIEQPAQLDPHTPSTFIFAFLAHLLWTAPLADGKEQFNGITVDHGEETGRRQKPIAPVLMGLQQALQTGAIGQSSKQVGIIATEPAIEGAKVPSFQGKQDPNRDQFTGIQDRLAVFGHVFHLVIDNAKNLNDNVFGRHASLRSAESVF